MNNFSNIDRPSGISNTPGGVWKIEKKRKARDKKNKQQNKSENEKKSIEELDDSVLVDIEFDREPDSDNEKESKDQTDYGFIKKKKSRHTRVDLKI
jgi:hypothetical protein